MGSFRKYGDYANHDYWITSTTFGNDINVNYIMG